MGLDDIGGESAGMPTGCHFKRSSAAGRRADLRGRARSVPNGLGPCSSSWAACYPWRSGAAWPPSPSWSDWSGPLMRVTS